MRTRNYATAAVSICLVAVVSVIAIFGARLTAAGTMETGDWPPFDMTYRTSGSVVAEGQQPAVTTTEIRRLEYRSKSDWTETVLESNTIVETAQGQFHRGGSWKRVEGRTITEYDNLDGSMSTTSVPDEVSAAVPHGALARIPKEWLDEVAQTTDVSSIMVPVVVCDGSECQSEIRGRQFVIEGAEYVFTDDDLALPLRQRDFEVLELRLIQ